MLAIEITRVDVHSGKAEKTSDCVAEEKPLSIFLNKARYATIFCSPSNLKELAVGHLLSEGIVKSVEEIDEVSLTDGKVVCNVQLKSTINIGERHKLSMKFYQVVGSACGSPLSHAFSGRLPHVESDLKVEAKTILDCFNQLNHEAETFRKTGGVHVAAIYDSTGKVEAFAEDVGRHNAVDKAIGIGALKRVDFHKCFLALSGRLNRDIVFKAVMVALPIVSSLAAAIDSGIAVARAANLTLVGFVRRGRMNVYSSPERICVESFVRKAVLKEKRRR